MTGLDHLSAVARGVRPDDDGLLGNARCVFAGSQFLSEEAILAAFAAQPFDLGGELLSVETTQNAALIGPDRAVLADLYDGRIGRLWRIGGGSMHDPEQHVDVAFDADMRQERGGVFFRAADHPELQPAAVAPILEAAQSLIERGRANGSLRVRAFVVRAFGDAHASAALLSLFTLGNETVRKAAFSYAAVGVGPNGVHAVSDHPPAREWTPRL